MSDAIPITTDGTNVWAGVDGGIVKVDGRTNRTSRIPADMRTGNGTVAFHDGDLWLSDYVGNTVERLDPTTGKVRAKAKASGPVDFTFVGDQVWVGSEKDASVMQLDPVTAKVVSTIPGNSRVIAGMGRLWHGAQPFDDPAVVGVDPATGQTAETIPVPKGSECSVGGEVPDNLWAGCTPFQSGASADGATVVRVDPTTGSVVATAHLPSFGGLVVVDGHPWFLVPSGVGTGNPTLALEEVDPSTGQVVAVRDLGSLDANNPVVSDDSLWIPDQAGQRLVRVALSDLSG